MANPVPKVNLSIYKNSTYKHAFLIEDGAGAPVDLTGYAAKLDMRASAATDPPLYQATSSDALSILPDGMVMLEIPATDIEAWEFDSAQYDLVLQPAADPDQSVCVARGSVVVYPHITDI